MIKHVLDTSWFPLIRMKRLEPHRNTPGARKAARKKSTSKFTVICYHLGSDNDISKGFAENVRTFDLKRWLQNSVFWD